MNKSCAAAELFFGDRRVSVAVRRRLTTPLATSHH